ncbi:hypothetical protein ABZ621_13620 [Streptomyces sp. NPDC007863]|uniref:hypothetical protein n=1 Tax=Streptomyces sp. NPDC007863 TaxID=3154894 RepID=UPI0033E7398F
MQSVRFRAQRLVTTALAAAGLAGLLTACGGAQPSAPQAAPAAAGASRTALPGDPGASAVPQDSRLPRPIRTAHTTEPTRHTSPPAPVRPQESATAHATPRHTQSVRPSQASPSVRPTDAPRQLPEGRLAVSDTARLTAEIDGLPSSARLVPGAAPVEFTVTFRNTGDVDFPLIAPVVRFDQYEGGLSPLGSVPGHLERFDPASGTWQPAPLPQAAGMDFLLVATGGAPLPRNADMTIRYRVALDAALGAGVTELQAYAVAQPSNHLAGKAATRVTIAP